MTSSNILVNSNWLINNLSEKKVKLFDASWYLPNLNREAYKEYKACHIPGANYFNIDEVCKKESPYPHMIPSKIFFERKMSELGIHNDDHVIIYSKDGIGTSPRAWWTLRLFGHKKVSILNGGLKDWISNKGKITNKSNKVFKKSKYKVHNHSFSKYSKFKEVVEQSINNNIKNLIIDARPEKRFLKLEPEPRPEIKSGTIPNSINLPYENFLNKEYMASIKDINNYIEKLDLNNKSKIICSCGSGVTACIIGFGLSLAGLENWSIYDGSWTEWYLRN